jgi:IS66 C-terminal element
MNPDNYLCDTLARISDGHPISRIDELMPWQPSQCHPDLTAGNILLRRRTLTLRIYMPLIMEIS